MNTSEVDGDPNVVDLAEQRKLESGSLNPVRVSGRSEGGQFN